MKSGITPENIDSFILLVITCLQQEELAKILTQPVGLTKELTKRDAVLTSPRLWFERGEPIFHEGAPVSGWAILCQGKAKRVVQTDRGKKVILDFCGPGDLLVGLVSGTYPYSAVAVTRSLVLFILGQNVASLARRYPEVLSEVNRRLGEEQCRLARRLADMAYGSVRARLVRVLLELCEKHGVPGGRVPDRATAFASGPSRDGRSKSPSDL